VDEREAVARRYGEHLSDHDLLVLAGGRAEQVPVLRRRPVLVLDLLDRPSVTDAVLAVRRDEPGLFSYLSPFLMFAAAVHRMGNALVGSSYVPDRTGPRSRLPVFDGPVLAAFAAEPQHRLFLAELLASYARLASGVVWRETLPPDEQPGLWRRIGDGALFLAGVFPEYAERSLGLVEIARLQHATGLRLDTAEGPISDFLEELAGRAYQRVGGSVPRAVVESPRSARRVLTLVADRYLFPVAAD
jgi:hypothetical protein